MKKSDLMWGLLLLCVSLIVIIPYTRNLFERLTLSRPYLMGFAKTAILASMGERLVYRFKKGGYFGDKGVILKFFVWGFLGMIFVVAFSLFANGVEALQVNGLLPVIRQTTFSASLLTAVLTSIFINLFFAPSFMLLHQVTDGYIEIGEGCLKKIVKVEFKDVIKKIDLSVFMGFIVLKTIPLFWIPAHTVTFLLPVEYRVLMAAYLSIALGIVLTVAKTKKSK